MFTPQRESTGLPWTPCPQAIPPPPRWPGKKLQLQTVKKEDETTHSVPRSAAHDLLTCTSQAGQPSSTVEAWGNPAGTLAGTK